MQLMNATDALQHLLSQHLAADVAMHKSAVGGYKPALAVIESRLSAVHEARLLSAARTVSDDAWMERTKGQTFQVGFRDNRNASAYNAKCATLGRELRALGFRTRTASSFVAGRLTLYATLPDVLAVALEVSGPYWERLTAAC